LIIMNLYNILKSWERKKVELKRIVSNARRVLAWCIAREKQRSFVQGHVLSSTGKDSLLNTGWGRNSQKNIKRRLQILTWVKSHAFGKVGGFMTRMVIFLSLGKTTLTLTLTDMLESIELLLKNILEDICYPKKLFITGMGKETITELKTYNYLQNIHYI